MSSPWIGMAVLILLMLVEILTGVRIRQAGKPYIVGPFAVHKILAAFMIVYLAVNVIEISQSTGLGPFGWVVPVSAMAVLLGMALSGGWMSVRESPPQALSTVHRLSAFPAVMLTAAAFYLLLKRSVS